MLWRYICYNVMLGKDSMKPNVWAYISLQLPRKVGFVMMIHWDVL